MYSFSLECNNKKIFFSNYRQLVIGLTQFNPDIINILKDEKVIFCHKNALKISPVPVKYICPTCNEKVFGIMYIKFDQNENPLISEYVTNMDIEDNTLHRYDFFPNEIILSKNLIDQEPEEAYRCVRYYSDNDILNFINEQKLQKWVKFKIIDFTNLKKWKCSTKLFHSDITINGKYIETKTFQNLQNAVQFINRFNNDYENKSKALIATQPYLQG